MKRILLFSHTLSPLLPQRTLESQTAAIISSLSLLSVPFHSSFLFFLFFSQQFSINISSHFSPPIPSSLLNSHLSSIFQFPSSPCSTTTIPFHLLTSSNPQSLLVSAPITMPNYTKTKTIILLSNQWPLTSRSSVGCAGVSSLGSVGRVADATITLLIFDTILPAMPLISKTNKFEMTMSSQLGISLQDCRRRRRRR